VFLLLTWACWYWVTLLMVDNDGLDLPFLSSAALCLRQVQVESTTRDTGPTLDTFQLRSSSFSYFLLEYILLYTLEFCLEEVRMAIHRPTEPLKILLRALGFLKRIYEAIPPLLWIQLILVFSLIFV
jgi:hypothetical protein